MLTREQARSVLDQYAQSRLARIALGLEGFGGPLIFLGDDEDPFRHIGTLNNEEDCKSAYHIAQAVHEAVEETDASSLTVCMFAYKVIQGIKYHGFMLYHVDADGTTHTRILDIDRWNHWILDGSEFWRSFPYSFEAGPLPMPAILGHHDEPVDAPDFDELLRP